MRRWTWLRGNRPGAKPAGKDAHSPRWCADQSPYPDPRVDKPNQYYAGLLMDDMAGAVSEMTAVTQYLYHHQILAERYPDVADLMECVSIVEMTHMELLGETIVLLGGKPKYGVSVSRGLEWWKGDLVYYGHDICDMLTADINAEIQAIAQYTRHIDIIDDQYIRALLARIILDEQRHVEAFTEKKNKYCRKL